MPQTVVAHCLLHSPMLLSPSRLEKVVAAVVAAEKEGDKSTHAGQQILHGGDCQTTFKSSAHCGGAKMGWRLICQNCLDTTRRLGYKADMLMFVRRLSCRNANEGIPKKSSGVTKPPGHLSTCLPSFHENYVSTEPINPSMLTSLF